MPETVSGVPLHPLIVHAVVVLLPLAALGTIVIALVPPWRKALAFTVLCVTVIATALVPFAQNSGETLREAVGEGRLVERHEELGQTLLYFAIPLLVVAIVQWLVARKGTSSRPLPKAWTVIISILSIAVAAATLVQVVRIGHSGSEAVWSGVVAAPASPG